MKTDLKIIRETFGRLSGGHLFYFNDKRKMGRRKVFKSIGNEDQLELWKSILRAIKRKGVEGWTIFQSKEPSTYYKYGIVKYVYKQLPHQKV
jgi:hypothetical protein